MDKELYKLTDVDPLDITDVIIKIEKSFNLKFDDKIFKDVKTFGELCDVILGEIKLAQSESCTTQQAFYKLHNAIAKVTGYDKCNIKPQTNLSGLIPRDNRRNIIADIESELGFKTHVLRPKQWVIGVLVLLLITSIFRCFFGWEVGLVGIVLSIIGLNIANVFGKELSVKTAGDLANKISRENYLKSRRDPYTVNRREVEKKITELFTDQLDLDSKLLTRNTSFV